MARPPNILLITSEDNGPQLGCYGDTTVPTPHLDALAASGVRFDNAYVTQAVCSPGRASILTGLYPHQCGQIGLATHRYGMYREYPSIPTLLKGAGYRTGRIGKLHVLPESAFAFDFVWNDPAYHSFAHRDVRRTTQAAADFLAQGDGPFFLMVNYTDAHLPWLAQDSGLPATPLTADDVRPLPAVGADSPRLRAHTANYYNCLSRLDTAIGMLLDTLETSGQAEDTVIVYVTDHGPQFSRGKCCVTEMSLRAPLLVRWPGVSRTGGACADLVSQVDLLPTLLDAAGVEAPRNLPGSSLRPLLAGTPTEWRRYLPAEWNASHVHPVPGLYFPQRTIRDERYKLVFNLKAGELSPVELYYTQQLLIDSGCTQAEIDASPEHVRRTYERWRQPPELELYDLWTDPHEFHDLAGDPALRPTRDRLLAALRKWQAETGDPFTDPALRQRFEAEYVAAAALEGGHKDPAFRWGYIDYFPPHPCG